MIAFGLIGLVCLLATGLPIGAVLLVLALVLFFFGAKRIPQIARGVGEGIRNFKTSVKDEEGDEDKQLPGEQDS